MTGLTDGQLAELTARVRAIHGDLHSNGRPYALGLYRSIAMVVALLRKNITQDLAGAIFDVSQSTASRRWDLLRPLIGEALADCVPDPKEIAGAATVLVDGTICPTWDWKAIPDLYSGKTGYLRHQHPDRRHPPRRPRRHRPDPRARRRRRPTQSLGHLAVVAGHRQHQPGVQLGHRQYRAAVAVVGAALSDVRERRTGHLVVDQANRADHLLHDPAEMRQARRPVRQR
jgi:hypothetical protein